MWCSRNLQTPLRQWWKFQGGGEWQNQKIVKKYMELNSNSQRGGGGIYIFWKLTLFLFDRQVLSVDFVGFVENSWNFFFLPTDFHTSCLYCFTIPLLSCILDSYNRPGMYITLLWPFWVITLAFCQITLSSGSSALQGPSIFNIFLSAGWLVPTLWPAGAWDGFILYLSIGQMEKRMYCILNVTGDFRPKRPG